ncbi:hypothetical protein [Priestia megaterium]|uniref:Uncharacterized protein n=1 Tax=Priestia megaterium TaxID=1404 RepID=A0A6M6E039_PRIMG|nr:hypothetical protein [Priestia megaterium]QJX80471.1 hypothetical protein FDZ14_30755 [Priestia megaterium]
MYTALYFYVGDFFDFINDEDKIKIQLDEEEVKGLADISLEFRHFFKKSNKEGEINIKDTKKLYVLMPFGQKRPSGAYMMLVKKGREEEAKAKMLKTIFRLVNEKYEQNLSDNLYKEIRDKLEAFITNLAAKAKKKAV